jgi:hypothetical protein
MKSHDTTYIGGFDANQSKSVYFEGGYNCDYTLITGVTSIDGNVSISEGSLIINSGMLIIM